MLGTCDSMSDLSCICSLEFLLLLLLKSQNCICVWVGGGGYWRWGLHLSSRPWRRLDVLRANNGTVLGKSYSNTNSRMRLIALFSPLLFPLFALPFNNSGT